MIYKPTQEEIWKVMRETGMGGMQARNHLIQRAQIQDNLRRNPVRSLGKSCYLGDDQ